MTKTDPKTAKDSTIFYRSFYEAICELPSENQLEIYHAIFELSFNFREINLSGVSKTIFTLIKPQIVANIRRYENSTKPKKKQKESKTEAKNKQTESKTLSNVNVNVNVNENENVNPNGFIFGKINPAPELEKPPESFLQDLQNDAFELWQKLAKEKNRKFTDDEWNKIKGYAMSQPSLRPHEILTNILALDKWANEGLDIEDSLLMGHGYRVLKRPAAKFIIDPKTNDRRYGTWVTNARNKQIEQEEKLKSQQT